MRAHWRRLHDQSENASQFHQELQELFKSSKKFQNMKIFHEVPVQDLVAAYPDNHFLDWYIDTLGICIELHGRQHYEVTSFGKGQSADAVITGFNRAHGRDQAKKAALEDAGFQYCEIPYNLQGKLTEELLLSMLGLANKEGTDG